MLFAKQFLILQCYNVAEYKYRKRLVHFVPRISTVQKHSGIRITFSFVWYMLSCIYRQGCELFFLISVRQSRAFGKISLSRLTLLFKIAALNEPKVQPFIIIMGKKVFHTFMYVTLLSILTACAKDESEIIEDVPQTCTVFLAPSRDIDVIDEPLSRSASTNDIYGINVYYDKEKDGKLDDIYGYGLFDNIEDMTIPLLTGYKYKFVCSLVKDGKSKLFYGKIGNVSYSGYHSPFQKNSNSSTILENKFILGDGTYLAGIDKGTAYLKDKSSSSFVTTTYPEIERFYGELADYSPTVNEKVVIVLKKTIFGAKFIIEGIQDGTLTASCLVNGSVDIWSKTTNSDDIGTETIYSYSDVYNCWKNELNLSAKVTLSFVSNRGAMWNLSSSKDIVFKRNIMTTVKIKVSPDMSSGVFNITEEELGEDYYIDLEINSDGLIDIPVEPTI